MNRTILLIGGLFSAPSVLLVDSAVKGTALLILSWIAAVMLRRDSAAARHLVWLLAIVALLAVPFLSAMLPQWQILPEWTNISPAPPVVAPRPLTKEARPAHVQADRPVPSSAIESPSKLSYQPAETGSGSMESETVQTPAVWSWDWRRAVPLVWAVGFCILMLRLMAASWVLWNTERLGTCVGNSRQPGRPTDDTLVIALRSACLQLGMHRPVELLVHPGKTIPVVWGIHRYRLLLPAAARHWDSEQLRSVLLHELAHIQRRDTLVQLLTQIACALHWFNPLVWFAAWRLGAERERACDDLVLASGVRPSAYAGHLLDVVTGLSPAHWMQVCGLAMARKSSLEGRLVAVLTQNVNRRRVSIVLGGIALALAIGIAVPLAMLRAADEKWDPPHAAHVGGNDFSSYCVHDGQMASYVIAYRGDLNSSSSHTSNSKTRTWTDDVTLTLKSQAGKQQLALHREHTAPDKLTLAGNDYDLTRGRVFVVSDNGESIRQFAIYPPAIREQAAADALAKQIAAIPPQARGTPILEPQHEFARVLFRNWQANARTDGKIPGGLIGSVARQVDTFIKEFPNDEKAPRLTALRPRLDTSRDWSPADVVALLDDITAISSAPVNWARSVGEMDEIRGLKRGRPLPVELVNAAWGAPAKNGLRAAWLPEPQAAKYPLGSILKCRVVLHNTGIVPVVFTTEMWSQIDRPTARDAQGVEIKVSGVHYMGIPLTPTYRLAPDEYCDIPAHGIAIGAGKYIEEFSTGSVGRVIEAKEGDEVHLTHTIASFRQTVRQGGPGGLGIVEARVVREAPLPASAADREQLIRRVTLDVLGEQPTNTDVVAFVTDQSPDALDKLTTRLQRTLNNQAFFGELKTGETTFLVTAVDPNAAKAPRTAIRPGRYLLADDAQLQVTQITTADGKRTNKATILFLSPDPTMASTHKPYEISLEKTFAFVWERGSHKLWVTDISDGAKIPIWLDQGGDRPGPPKVTVRAIDFSNPDEVQLTHVSSSENGSNWSWADRIPAQFQLPVIQVLGEEGQRLAEFVRQPQLAKPQPDVKLAGRIFVNAGLRTTQDEKRFSQSIVAIDPATGKLTRLQQISESGFTVPLSPVRVSPDGRVMLFMRDKQLWKCNATTGDGAERLLERGSPVAWSPDGKTFIAIVEPQERDGQVVENWIMSAAGQKQSMLALPKGDAIEDWSADGEWLTVRSRLDSQVYVVKPDGSGRRRLAASVEYSMGRSSFSPDSKHIVYLSRQTIDDKGRFSLRRINVNGTDDRELLAETKVVFAPDSALWTAPMAAQWSPDGKHLAVVLFDHTRDGGIFAINGNWRLAIIDADGGNLRELKLEGVLNMVLPWDGPQWRG